MELVKPYVFVSETSLSYVYTCTVVIHIISIKKYFHNITHLFLWFDFSVFYKYKFTT